MLMVWMMLGYEGNWQEMNGQRGTEWQVRLDGHVG